MGVFLKTLQQLSEQEKIRQIDYQFAHFIYQQASAAQDELALLAGMLSIELGKGNICLPLFDSNGVKMPWEVALPLADVELGSLSQQVQAIDWRALIQSSALVGSADQSMPIIFDGTRLYMQRYWHYESVLTDRFTALSQTVSLTAHDVQTLTQLLDQLFARNYAFLHSALTSARKLGQDSQVIGQQLICDQLDVVNPNALDWQAIDALLQSAKHAKDLQPLDTLVPAHTCLNWQKVAAAIALTRKLAVISGGPGTGKTTTVTKLLVALITHAHQQGVSPKIKLVAPTGKAAARLTESIGRAVEQLPIAPELKQHIPTESSTVHRLLDPIPNSNQFRHGQHNPLHLDVLVVDEASMVDLSMMYRLIDALPPRARLILLGDKDQLASVEAGSVLGDMCMFHQYGYSQAQAQTVQTLTHYSVEANLASVPSMADSLCVLQKSYRFDARSGIGQLARAINSGDLMQMDKVWHNSFADIERHALSSANLNQMVSRLTDEYKRYLQCIPLAECDADAVTTMAKAALDTFGQCRLLCAVREGEFGVAGLNLTIERALAKRRLVLGHDEQWYHGRPVMVTRNDHNLGLYNGDTGICIFDGERLKVFFELPDGSVKAILPSRVPEHDTAYAMTIHKSQGSEFNLVMMVLPKEHNPVLSRELIYTGVTRAKQAFALYSNVGVLKKAVKTKTERASGLAVKLHHH